MYAEVNLVSLIDLMMLLMVIFMITAPMMQGGVDLTLPKAEARAVESKGGVTISVTANGRIYIDESLMSSMSAFRASFRLLAAKQSGEGVYLRADQRAAYGTVAQVIAIMNAAGVTKIALVAEPEDVSK
jgi:biopolymer transport protein ExbD